MAFNEANGVRLYYEVHGNGPQTILFAHGKGGNHLSWWQQIPYFMENYRCIIIDHRSYGMSVNSNDGRNQDAFVDDACALLDSLEVDSAFFVGQSMGGRTCLDFALRYPERVRGLVLASTIAGVVDSELQDILALHANAPKELLPRVLGENFRSANAELSFLFSQIEALNHAWEDPFPLVIKGASKADVQNCKVPTLMVVGQDDLVAPPPAVGWLASVMPNAQLEVIPDTGHSIYFERPAIFNYLVQRFFAQQD